ncbi:LexA family transcriptional regulator [Tyzzerella sp. OttesenSCG-928-J15]|nr:LexA family transcriptional regulator [Tyzzerella sp. OttesenSCG-928-J15]
MSLNQRIQEVRESLDLTQEKFSERINLTRSSISNIEKGKREASSRVISDICREFSVNEEWLRTGKGEMFNETLSSIIDDLAAKYRLDELDKRIIEEYAKLTPPQREAIKTYMRNINFDDIDADMPVNDIIEIVAPELTGTEEFDDDEELVEVRYTSDMPASAGTGSIAHDIAEFDKVRLPASDLPRGFNPDKDYIIRISGDSMEPVLSNGDYVYIRKQPAVYYGEIGVFLIDEGIFIKEYQKGCLVSLNDSHPDIYLHEGQEVHCFGQYLGKVDKDYLS